MGEWRAQFVLSRSRRSFDRTRYARDLGAEMMNFAAIRFAGKNNIAPVAFASACLLSALAVAANIFAEAQSPVAHDVGLPRERIVYTMRRPANWHLYLFEGKSSPKQITDDPALDYDAIFSPDGQ